MFHYTSARWASEAWAHGSFAVQARDSLCDVSAVGLVSQRWLAAVAASHQTTVAPHLHRSVESMERLGMELAQAARSEAAPVRQCVVAVEHGHAAIGSAVVIATAGQATETVMKRASRRRRVGDAGAGAGAGSAGPRFEVLVMSWGDAPWPADDPLTAAFAAQLGPGTRVVVNTTLRIRRVGQPGGYQAAQTLHAANRGACAETMIAYATARVCLLGELAQDAVLDIATMPATQLVVALHAFVELLLLVTVGQVAEISGEVCERYLRPEAYLDALRPGVRSDLDALRPGVRPDLDAAVVSDVHHQVRTPGGLYGPAARVPHNVLAALSSSTRHRLAIAAHVRALAKPFVERSWQGTPVKFMRAADLDQLLVQARDLGAGSYGSVRAVMVKTHPTDDSQEVLMQTVVDAEGAHVQLPVVIADKDMLLKSRAAVEALAKPCLGLVALQGTSGGQLAWRGSSTPWRELATAAVLTRLVERCISPHVAMQYAVLPVRGTDDDKPHARALMELAGADLTDALQDVSAASAEPAHYVQSINVLLWQVLYTLLAAHVHARVRHNDLHIGNVLVSSVAAATDVYVVPTGGQAAAMGLGRRVWRVPNMGMCAKLIDWGHATSTKLFGYDDHTRHSYYTGPQYLGFNMERTASDALFAVATELQDAVLLFDLLLHHLSTQRTPAAVLARLEDAIWQCVRLTRGAADPAVRVGMAGLLATNPDGVQREAALAAQSTDKGNGLLAELVHWWGHTSGFPTQLEAARGAGGGTCFAAPGHSSTWDMTRSLFGGEAASRDSDTSAAVLSLQGTDDGDDVAEVAFGSDPFEMRLFRAMDVAGHAEVWPVAPCPKPADREEGEEGEEGSSEEEDDEEAGARAGAGAPRRSGRHRK